MDFLGIKMLTVIRDATLKVKQIYGVKLDIDRPPLDDRKAFSLFENELTAGIFQFSSMGMKRYLRDLKPNSLQELIAMNAIYRPGPMAWIPVYIAERRGRKAKFNHPEDEESFSRFKKICEDYPPLKDILQETSLIPIYQEQIMEICRIYAGFSLGKSDNVRKAMGKKDQKLIDQLRKSFVDGAVEKGHQEQDAVFVYDQFIVPFGGYGFNKSHSACYAFLAYQTAYLKGNYPLAFMTALLNAELLANYTGNIQEYIRECNVMKIEVMASDINFSKEGFQVKKRLIVYGLAAIKNVGGTAAKSIVAERERNGKYQNIGDFLLRHGQEKMNKQAVEALVKSGAFDSLGIDSDALLAGLEEISERIRKERDLSVQGQMSFFELNDVSNQMGRSQEEHLFKDLLEKIKLNPSTLSQKKTLEKEALGFNLRYDLMINYRHLFEEYTNFNTLDKNSWKNGRAQLAGVVQSLGLFYTKKENREMVRWEVNDGRVSLSLISLPNHWDKIKQSMIEQERLKENSSSTQIIEYLKDKLVKLQVIIRDDHFNQNSEKVLIVDELLIIDEVESKPKAEPKDFWIEIDGSLYLDSNAMDQVLNILVEYQGSHQVYLFLKHKNQKQVFPTSFKVDISDALKFELRENELVKDIRITSSVRN